MAKLELEEVFVNKTFPIAMDGVGVKTKICHKGVVTGIPKHLVQQLEDAGYISSGDDVPVVDDVEDEGTNGNEEFTVAYFIEQGKEAMLIILEDEEEELTGDETDEELANLCVAVFAEDED